MIDMKKLLAVLPEEKEPDYMDEFGAGYNACLNDIKRGLESLADMGKVKCEQCHKELDFLEVLHFNHEGGDFWLDVPMQEHGNGVYVDVSFNWCGHEQDDDDAEKIEAIRCPHCGRYPFNYHEIQTYEYERVVMFLGDECPEEDLDMVKMEWNPETEKLNGENEGG